jgi:hypothetical protein
VDALLSVHRLAVGTDRRACRVARRRYSNTSASASGMR